MATASSSSVPTSLLKNNSSPSLTLTTVEIPCCLCGTRITPNAANQCSSCLASRIDLAHRLQAGPGGSPFVTIHQCRNCRRFARTPTRYEAVELESPELLSICLRHIPALTHHNSSEPKLQLVDAGWIWTEPHCMRLQLHLTVRTEVEAVLIQQRVKVEQHIAWQMCESCNREFTNRTWHAMVQLRQYRTDDAPKKGLAALELALAKNKEIRRHVLRMNTGINGFDFYFLNLPEAQAFASYLQRVAPMRVKTSQKLVSTDNHSNTANMKHTVSCDVLPLCRDDLVLIHKKTHAKLAGRLTVVTKVSSTVHLQDAAPSDRMALPSSLMMELGADAYYKNEKNFRVLVAGHRLTRFVVLDVELCSDTAGNKLYQGPESGVDKYALADVVVAREADFGVNDETLTTVCHLGHLIRPGDTVLGYDLSTTVGGDWELDKFLHSGVVVPDVVLVKKVASSGDASEKTPKQEGEVDPSIAVADSGEKPAMTKKMARRRRRQEGKKSRELEETAVRMGFIEEEDEEEEKNEKFVVRDESSDDAELAADVKELERAFASMELPTVPVAQTDESFGNDAQQL